MKKNALLAGFLFVTGVSQITAQEKEKPIDEVTIASKTAKEIYKTGKIVRLISAKDLEKHRGESISDVLQQVSGIQITGNYNNASEPKSFKINGGKSANVLILLDGIPLKDVTGNDYTVSDLRLLALENIESIEILNSASSVLYGSNATVSVININTKKTTLKPIAVSVGLRGGSFGTFGQNALVRGKIEQLNYQISTSNEKSEGFSAALGENFDKDGFKKQNINTTIGADLGKIKINLNAGYHHIRYDFDYSAFTDATYKGNDNQAFIGGSAEYNYQNGKLVFNSRYAANIRLTQDLINNTYTDQYSYKGKNIFAELFNQYQFTDEINATAGVQYETQNIEYLAVPFGGTILEPVLTFDTGIKNIDAFANVLLKKDIYHLETGARLNHHSKYGNHLVYSINPYILEISKNMYYKIGYSFATAFIAPTLYQNYGSAPYTLPNFELNPETNTSHQLYFELGNTQQDFVFNINAFQRKEDNVITFHINQFKNIEDNKIRGLEIGLKSKIKNRINYGINYAYVEKNKAATMLRTPKHRFNNYVDFSFFKGNRTSFYHQYLSKRDDAYFDMSNFTTKNVELKSYHLFNLNINQKINKNLETYLSIGNLFNKNYIDVIGYTTKPRNYILGVNYQF